MFFLKDLFRFNDKLLKVSDILNLSSLRKRNTKINSNLNFFIARKIQLSYNSNTFGYTRKNSHLFKNNRLSKKLKRKSACFMFVKRFLNYFYF